MLAWEVQRATRYQDFLSLALVRVVRPGASLAGLRDSVGQRVVQLLRASDVVGMIGEDLGVVLVHTPDTEAIGIAERMQRGVEELVASAATMGDPRGVTVAVSLVGFPGDATSDDILLARAQARLPTLS